MDRIIGNVDAEAHLIRGSIEGGHGDQFRGARRR